MRCQRENDRMRLAGKIQPMAQGRTNKNYRNVKWGNTWKVVLIEGRQAVSSLALSLPSGVTRNQRWTGAKCVCVTDSVLVGGV